MRAAMHWNHRFKAVAIAVPVLLHAACGEEQQTPIEPPVVSDSIPAEIVTWLQANAVPFNTAQAGGDYTDMMPLEEMVGAARVVALGETTHGTREFFQMKHRVLEFLVEEADFNLFAIEATWPEANRLNEYVHTGQGDPATLLSGLYFWTWNTEEVLEMIQWMRQHNENPGSAPTVSFLGFDMQFPGMAIYNVLVFLEAVDPGAAAFATEHTDCLTRFANGPAGYSGAERYSEHTQTYRDACLADVSLVYDSLEQHRTAYEAASSPEEFAKALRSARLIIQYEDMASGRTAGARDLYMAENAKWLLDQAGAGAKIVLWAHNGHVADSPSYGSGASMGHHLRAEYGGELVIVGFDFHHGSFRAVTVAPSGGYGALTDHTVFEPPRSSYEYYFHAAGYERFFLDLRGVDTATPATSWLAGPRQMRSIGAAFKPSRPGDYFYDVALPTRFDLIIYFDATSAAIGLPYDPPGSW
jgi:erythromycin esterase